MRVTDGVPPGLQLDPILAAWERRRAASVIVYGSDRSTQRAIAQRICTAASIGLILAARCLRENVDATSANEQLLDQVAVRFGRLPRQVAEPLGLAGDAPFLAGVSTGRDGRSSPEPLRRFREALLAQHGAGALAYLLSVLARHAPCAVLIEDLQWADGRTLMALHELLSSSSRPLVLCLALVRTPAHAPEPDARVQTLRSWLPGEVHRVAADRIRVHPQCPL